MRTVTFSNPEVAEAVNGDFISAWRNRNKKFHNCSPGTENWIKNGKTESYPTMNITTFFLTPNLEVMHYFTGYYAPGMFLDELKFVRTLRKEVYKKDFSLKSGGAAKFAELHAKHAGEHSKTDSFLSKKKAKISPRYGWKGHKHGDSCISSLRDGLRYMGRVHDWFKKQKPGSGSLALEKLLNTQIAGNRFQETNDQDAAAGFDERVAEAIKRARAVLKKTDGTEQEQLAAVRILAKLKHADVARELGKLLKHPLISLRILAARSLAKFKGVSGVVDILLDGLEIKSNQTKKFGAVRIVIVRSLGKLKAVEATEVLNKLISDPYIWVAKAAVDAVGRLGQKSSVAPLIRELRLLVGKDREYGDTRPEEPDPTEEPVVRNRLEEMSPVKDIIKEKLNSIPNLPKGAADVLKENILDELAGGGTPDVPKKPEREDPPEEETEELKTRREIMVDPILKSLNAITGQTHSSPRDWIEWWDAANPKEKKK